MKSIILFLLVLISFSSCKKSDSEIVGFSMSPNSSELDQVKFVKPVVANAEEITEEPPINSSQKEQKTTEQKIIKEANLRFETTDLNSTYNQILKNTTESGGSIQNDTEGKDYGTIFRRLIIRVPSQNFDVFLKNISKGVSYFDNKEISAQDVTTQYIDIDARLKTKKVLENRYIELLKKATKVSEMLEVEAQLSAIREEIEAKQGQFNYLQDRISLSTVTVEFYKPVAPDSGITVSYGMKIWNAAKSGFNSFSSFFISLISVWPFLILLGIVFYFVKKRFKKKTV
ncbi:protein of unknown function [Flavobacterium gillisiae]|uniref:DUF4349 domain-containing protein n=1 Tax=Flavobacterium gillisiae TaxID=150146 RepID=A0A1H3Z2S3_9FLAO|nr:DUF4349 domain-containing protein [Flavobacterium gillisiae]SEA18153.1 protein of unknown function [Flavobacterium gillisiae]